MLVSVYGALSIHRSTDDLEEDEKFYSTATVHGPIICLFYWTLAISN